MTRGSRHRVHDRISLSALEVGKTPIQFRMRTAQTAIREEPPSPADEVQTALQHFWFITFSAFHGRWIACFFEAWSALEVLDSAPGASTDSTVCWPDYRKRLVNWSETR